MFLSVSLHPSVKRCCVMSSWLLAALKCQPTGWSWRPVAPTFVPCLQVNTSWCLLGIISDVCVSVLCVVLNCVCFSLYAGDMSESKAQQVEIREVDGQTLKKLVDYIYTAEIEVTEDNVQVSVCSWRGRARGKVVGTKCETVSSLVGKMLLVFFWFI